MLLECVCFQKAPLERLELGSAEPFCSWQFSCVSKVLSERVSSECVPEESGAGCNCLVFASL